MSGAYTPAALAERWLPIPGFPGYLISDQGRVRGSRRQGTPGVVLKPRCHKTGYIEVALTNGRRDTRKDIRVHRLVLLAFVGPSPPGTVAAHLDGNKHNNFLSNLAWVTQKENRRQRIAHGTDPAGTRHPESKLTEIQLAEIRRLAGTMRNIDLGKLFGVSGNVIYCIRTGRTYK